MSSEKILKICKKKIDQVVKETSNSSSFVDIYNNNNNNNNSPKHQNISKFNHHLLQAEFGNVKNGFNLRTMRINRNVFNFTFFKCVV
jgi:hypothetical protein